MSCTISITHDDRLQQPARETNNSSTNLNNTTICNNAVIFLPCLSSLDSMARWDWARSMVPAEPMSLPRWRSSWNYFPHIFQLIGSGWMAYLRSRLSQQLNGWDFSSAKKPLFWNVGTLKPLESIHGGKEHTNHHPFWKGTWSEPNLQGIIVQPLIFRGVFLADLSCLTSSQLQFSSAMFQGFYS